jgi:hypothetical protein
MLAVVSYRDALTQAKAETFTPVMASEGQEQIIPVPVAQRALIVSMALPLALLCQNTPPSDPVQSGVKTKSDSSSSDADAKPDKRILWVIPNFRTSPTLEEYKPLSPKEKFRIAGLDSWDRGTVALAAAFAGESQISNSEPEFGQGLAGYARRFGTSYADFVIGNYMTEAIYPTILHQDPRYFRKGTGSGVSRFRYAVKQIFWTHKDSGGTQFNYSEVVGNSTAVAISMAYYSDGRTVSNAITSLGTQLGVDTASNILKEFWPDLERKFSKKDRISKDLDGG